MSACCVSGNSYNHFGKQSLCVKLNVLISYKSSIPLLGVVLKKLTYLRNILEMYKMFIAPLLVI